VPPSPNNTLNVSRADLGAPVERDLHKTGFRGSPCYLDPTTRSMFRVPDRAPPLNGIFIKPASGARRATWTQQRAQCFACGLGRPVELDLHKTGFGGSPCYLDTTTRSTFRVRPWAPPVNWIFVKPASGARRATWTQQHAQRFACRIGRSR
jgi:hypothetical protein